jgi:threonine dehydrogenase-like Zn-dependent dehydrogenase
MRGVTFPGDGAIGFDEFPDPTPMLGEVVVEMKASGICGTDLGLMHRPASDIARPVIAGHEPCGVVVELGPGVSPAIATCGDRVMVHHYHGCGTCEHCRSGWAQLCQSAPRAIYGNNANGGHARYLTVPAATLVTLPDALTFTTGAAISCGTGTAFAALRRINVSGHDTVAIVGQGPVGLSGTLFAKAFGARVIALDVSPERLARAREFGADVTIDPSSTDAVAAILEATGGRGADATLESSGAQAGGTIAIRGTKTWGSVCLVAGYGGLDVSILTDIVFRQLTIVGSWTFSIAGQIDCARFIVERELDVDRLFTHRWKLDLDDAREAYRMTERQSAGKGVFVM